MPRFEFTNVLIAYASLTAELSTNLVVNTGCIAAFQVRVEIENIHGVFGVIIDCTKVERLEVQPETCSDDAI